MVRPIVCQFMDKDSGGLKRKALSGVVWSATERFAMQGVTLLVMIVMARRLTPADYGLVGIALIFTDFGQSLVDCGFSQALIRRRNPSPADSSSVFWFNLAVSVALFALLWFLAPLIAGFFASPLLTPIIRIISLVLPVFALTAVQRALLSAKVDFKSQAWASVLGAVVGGAVGIFMAYTGWGVWAIAWSQVVNAAAACVAIWFFSSWRPSCSFSKGAFRDMFGFGSRLALAGLINTLFRNLYSFVIGRFFSAADLGFFTRARQFSAFPTAGLKAVAEKVSYPILCEMQDDDSRLFNAYRRILRICAFIVFPVNALLIALAYPLVEVLLTSRWLAVAPLLQILSLAFLWLPIQSVNLNILQVKGRSDLFLRLEVWKKVLMVLILVATIPLGVSAMCWGLVVHALLSLAINAYWPGRLIGFGLFRQLRDSVPSLALAVGVGASAFAVASLFAFPFYSLVAGAAAGIAFFAIFAIACRKRLSKLLPR